MYIFSTIMKLFNILGQKVTFWKLLSKHGYAATFSDEVVYHNLANHHQIFVLDTLCPGYKNVLNKVIFLRRVCRGK